MQQRSFRDRAQQAAQRQRHVQQDAFDDGDPGPQRQAQDDVVIGTHIRKGEEQIIEGRELLESFVELDRANKEKAKEIQQLKLELQKAKDAVRSSSSSGNTSRSSKTVSDDRGVRIAQFFIVICTFFVGIRLMLFDANFSTIALSDMGVVPVDWNVGNWQILWGVFGTWSPWYLLQSLVSAIQLTLTPVRWQGFKENDGTLRFPFAWSYAGQRWLTPIQTLMIFSVAFLFNVGTTYIGVVSDMPNWKPIKIFTTLNWPTEGAGQIFIALSICVFLSLGGERIVTMSSGAIMTALKDKFWK